MTKQINASDLSWNTDLSAEQDTYTMFVGPCTLVVASDDRTDGYTATVLLDGETLSEATMRDDPRVRTVQGAQAKAVTLYNQVVRKFRSAPLIVKGE